MTFSRRHFMMTAASAGAAFGTLSALPRSLHAHTVNSGLALVPDPEGLLDLPEGYSYTVVSQTGGVMSDGFLRPGRPDGMACFSHPDPRKCILVRNHEHFPDMRENGPFGADNALAEQLEPKFLYDRRADGSPYIGGTTTVIYDLDARRIEREFLSLAGTAGNCAGGATPWGSWLSCEETDVGPDNGATKAHGFVFEVPADAPGPVEPVPLKAMGRFVHEAAAVDPRTDIVYMTEDALEGLFYRFLPKTREKLDRGGQLQALAIRGWKSADTRNWPKDWGSTGPDGVEAGREYEVDWIDLDNVDAPDRDLRLRGYAAGAARFCRGEGMAFAVRPGEDGAVYFNCTQGGAARVGQVWRYRPSREEGKRGERRAAGTLTLIYESPGADTLDLCDNLAVSPAGDLILCEDGLGDQYLRSLSPDGKVRDLARNAHPRKSEFCGACFSPDGSVMFVNIQEPGITLAVEGPWSA